MDVFVIRHAQALDRSAPIEDGYRPLTARGRKDGRRMGRALRRLEVELDAIVTSPLVRAVETAELVAIATRFDGALDVAPELMPERDPVDVVREVLMLRADLARVAVVGHQPQLGAFLGLLLHRPPIDLAKAGVVRLRWDGPEAPARIKWVLRPGLDEPSRAIDDVA